MDMWYGVWCRGSQMLKNWLGSISMSPNMYCTFAIITTSFQEIKFQYPVENNVGVYETRKRRGVEVALHQNKLAPLDLNFKVQ